MPRDPRQIQLEIDSARESLAATLDQIAYRTSSTRLKAQGKDAVRRFLQTPAGQATMGAAGLLVTLVVVQKIRHRKRPELQIQVQPRGREVVVEKTRYRTR